MLKGKTPFFMLLLLAGFLTACSNNNTDATPSDVATTEAAPATPDAVQMPSFSMIDAGGQTLDLKNFAGKKVFVNMWATWCPPCRTEMPSIQKLQQSVDKNKAEFIMLSLDESFEKAKQYVAENNLSLPIYHPQDFENMPDLFNVRVLPTTFIFDENGQLVKTIEGLDDYDTDVYRKMLNQ